MNVRVIFNNENLGFMTLEQAHNIAQKEELDLVKLNDDTYKIMDQNKFTYEKKKKSQKSKQIKIKEVRFTYKIDENDYLIKVKQINEFLKSKMKVIISLRLKGREISYSNLAKDLLNKVITDCDSLSKASQLSVNNNSFSVTLSPK